MYSYIQGTLTEIENDAVVIDCGGVGYEVHVSQLLKTHLPVAGSDIKLYTYMYLGENIQALYGFLSRTEKEMFLLMLGVNSVGPKAAMALLSTMEVEDIKFAILSEDAKTLSKANGIGPKAAQRLIIDLKDKISLEDAFEEKLARQEDARDNETEAARSDAVMALVALGYSNTEVLKAISRIGDISGMDTQAIIKAALAALH